MKRAAIYLRISTQDQTTSNQEHELRRAAEQANWQVVRVYKDHGIAANATRSRRRTFPDCERKPGAGCGPGPAFQLASRKQSAASPIFSGASRPLAGSCAIPARMSAACRDRRCQEG